MNAIAMLEKQLSNINTLFHSIVQDLTEQEWLTRPTPSQNFIGYTVWHLPRVGDHMVQIWIRGAPELIHHDRWAHWRHLERFGNGVGITLEEADEIARSVQRVDALEYADAVHQATCFWLRGLMDDDLDRIPDARTHLLPFPEYQTRGYREEMDDLLDLPIWSLLMRPCIGHIHRHLGELQLAKEIARASK